MLLNALFDRQVVFFGGKGGVGKTTCSAAFALAASQRGQRVLLVSTDPAHSTADIFERSIGAREITLAPNLSAMEIDGEQEAARYIGEVKRDIQKMFSAHVVQQAHQQIEVAAASPGMTEVALLDRMIALILDRQQTFDLIVFDTAPTGHTLQLLRMPDAMNTWIDALVKHRRAVVEIDHGAEPSVEDAMKADPILAALTRRQERLVRLRRTIMDRTRTTFALVTIAERLAIEETERAAALLRDTGVDIGGLIVNRVLPHGLEGDFYRQRKAQEETYLQEIDRRFTRLCRVRIEQLPRDVYGMASLALVSKQLVTS